MTIEHPDVEPVHLWRSVSLMLLLGEDGELYFRTLKFDVPDCYWTDWSRVRDAERWSVPSEAKLLTWSAAKSTWNRLMEALASQKATFAPESSLSQ